MANEIVSESDVNNGLTVVRPPKMVLEEAQKAAKALQEILATKKRKVMMNGEQYLEFEDWQTVAKFYGATVKVISTNPIQIGDAVGFEARAVVLDSKTGMEVSAADAMCLNDEDKWSKRPKYSVIEGVREQIGEEAVPMFQLRSMAQTRACAKALRNVFAWVIVLAGYRPTPAEELDEATRADASTENSDTTLRKIKSKFKSRCVACGTPVRVNEDIIYDSKNKQVYHESCFKSISETKKETGANAEKPISGE